MRSQTLFRWTPVLTSFVLLLWIGCGGTPDVPTPTTPPADTPPSESPLDVDADEDGYSELDGDCDDHNNTIHPDATDVPYNGVDEDCSGTDVTDVDGDGYDSEQVGGKDCDDSNTNTYPGAPEIGDGEDNDCDGLVDEDLDTVDNDKDGYTEARGDCDDTDPNVNPGEDDIPYNGTDEDCSGSDLTDVDGDGAMGGPTGTDCEDEDSAIYPGATEVPYDGLDQDCSGADLTDIDGDGVPGRGAEVVDCDDHDPTRSPALPEIPYDGIDNNCDGTDLTDVDTDGYNGLEADGDDCNDEDASVNPGELEIPYDTIDQDCSGADLTDVDGDHVDGIEADGLDCDDENANTYPGATEIGDGQDNDCDGQIDEALDNVDNDQDGYSELEGDCNDADPTRSPGATEVPYNGIDEDCSGTDLTDVDGDGYPGGTGSGARDCNDQNPSVNPGSTEVPYDAIDQDCSGADLTDVDGDGFSSTAVTGGKDCNDNNALINPNASDTPYDAIDQDCSGKDLTDVDKDGYDASVVSGGKDCNDNDPAIHPGAAELCDTIDNNCDNVVDTDAIDRATFYKDGDHDTYGDPNTPVKACAASDTLVSNNTDCNDNNASVYPNATETCDSLDNDCDTQVDEGVSTPFYQDSDGDTYGNGKVTTQACSKPSGYVSNNTDCNDSSAAVYPGATEVCDLLDNDCDTTIDEDVQLTFYLDADGDGYGNPSKSVQACTVPEGYVTDKTDCKDSNDAIHPGAAELCDNVDQNCNGTIDEGVTQTFYQDADNDGYGNSAVTKQACTAPSGYVSNKTDCNDSSASVYPGATETCNSVDDNCDGTTDEGVKTTWYADADLDTYGSSTITTQACTRPTGYVATGTDCNDANPAINPGATEVCDSANVDENCNGVADNNDSGASATGKTTYYPDIDQDGYGNKNSVGGAYCDNPSSSSAAYVTNKSDCNDSNNAIYPGATEVCNGVDDNCDGNIDDGAKTTYYVDADGDGYGSTVSTQACSKPTGYSTISGDCNDASAAINPGATEICDPINVDENCNGTADNADSGASNTGKTTYYPDVDQDGYGNKSSAGVLYCDNPSSSSGAYVTNKTDCNDSNAAINPAATELCNGVDENCDGSIDEGVKTTYYADGDGDGYGSTVSTQSCSKPTGYVTNSTDCNDANIAINPAATEVCDSLNVDENCNGVADNNDAGASATGKTTYYPDVDQDGYGNKLSAGVAYCDNPSSSSGAYVTNKTDCNDSNAAINPAATEVCNGVDDNCDGNTDSGITTTYYADSDNDGYGSTISVQACSKPTGYSAVTGDCNDASASVNPGATETCNSVDDNCNGSTDEGVQTTFYRDADGDGYGTATTTAPGCSAPSGYVSNKTDCNDASASINPGATEVCDSANVDENCNGVADDADSTVSSTGKVTYYPDSDKDGYGNSASSGTAYCDNPSSGSNAFVTNKTDCNDSNAAINPGATESCNGVDDNCNGVVDDGSGAPGSASTFNYTGAVQTFTVPTCVTSVTITAYGAEGNRAFTSYGYIAGKGGMASGKMTVTPGQLLYIYVGGQNGYNGGAAGWSGSTTVSNGGGASDVRTSSTDLSTRVIVAGGGGGVAGESNWGNGGNGGGGSCGTNYCGGQAGGGYYNTSGTNGGSSGGAGVSGCHGGAGGGAGIVSGGGGATTTCYGTYVAGTGLLGTGGVGTSSPSGCCQTYGAAGGGGGYYGGGGAAGGCCGGGGAGGGSSWTGTLSNPTFSAGVRSGNGQVVISY